MSNLYKIDKIYQLFNSNEANQETKVNRGAFVNEYIANLDKKQLKLFLKFLQDISNYYAQREKDLIAFFLKYHDLLEY